MSVFRVCILTVVLMGCATDLSYETERIWCVGACVLEHSKTERHSETASKSSDNLITDK